MGSEQNELHYPSGMKEFSFTDTEKLEKDLTCNVCSRYLNVVPIIFSENLGSICGRCNTGATLRGIGATQRQQSYEQLIKHLTFPCANKIFGCLEVVKFDYVLTHEKNCRYQCVSCPLSYKHLFPEKNCHWKGNSKLLLEHLKVHHEEFLDPPQFEWPEKGKNKIFFTYVGKQVIIIVIKHEREGRFSNLLMINGTDLESQCFRYQLELSDEDKNNSILLRRGRLEPISEFLDFLSRPDKTLEVDIDQMSEMLQNPQKIFAKFGIVKKPKKEIIQIMGVQNADSFVVDNSNIKIGKEKNTHLDEEMLSELECPICSEFMVPPIYICPTGHSVCSVCKVKVNMCPSCRSPFGNGRNFTLEKLTLKVKYPCRHRDIGCGFVSTSENIKNHEKICDLAENPCILRCGWKGLTSALYNHFLEHHKTQILKHNALFLKDMRQDINTGFYFLYVMGELFCLSLKINGKVGIRFNMEQVGYLESEPKHKYTLQFFLSSETSCPSISLTGFCQNWNENLTELGNNSINVPMELLLKYCIFKNFFFYMKVNIMKV
ncbi:uncharacterized protein [Euwallacea fornicatus]|uniref:uncharacterized protein n=1 Tax=Euwallacea fornicatus TaxID=995702 RepID=UPI00338F1E2D